MPTDPKETARTAQAGAEDLKRQAQDTANRAAAEARHQATDLANQARDAAYEGAARVRAEAERRARAGVDYGANEVSTTADALRKAAEEAGESTIQGQVLRYAADGLTDVSRSIRGKSLGDMAADVADFGRRNPVAFLGGAALAGFAISRFVRASRPEPRFDGPRGPYGAQPTPGGGPAYGRVPGQPMSQQVQPATAHTPATGTGPARSTDGMTAAKTTTSTGGSPAHSTGGTSTDKQATSTGGGGAATGTNGASGTTSTAKGTPNV